MIGHINHLLPTHRAKAVGVSTLGTVDPRLMQSTFAMLALRCVGVSLVDGLMLQEHVLVDGASTFVFISHGVVSSSFTPDVRVGQFGQLLLAFLTHHCRRSPRRSGPAAAPTSGAVT